MAGGDGRAVPRLLRASARRRAGPCDHRRRHRARRGGRGDAADGRRAAAPARAADPGRARPRCGRRRPIRSRARFTHQGDPNQAYALIGWSTLGGTRPYPRAARAGARRQHVRDAPVRPAARGGRRDLFARRRRISPPRPFRDWGIFYAAAEIRPASADTFFRIAREIVADLAARPAAAGRVRAGAESGDQRHRAAARDQRLLDRARWRIGSATRVTSRMCAPISPIIAR